MEKLTRLGLKMKLRVYVPHELVLFDPNGRDDGEKKALEVSEAWLMHLDE